MGKSNKAKKTQEVYHVEVISRARVVPVDSSEDEGKDDRRKKGKKKRKKPVAKWEYYVKWANYDSDANSWEPEENLEGCQRLRESFWKHIGMDDRDYMIGYEVAASHDWIDKEKAFFKQEFAMAQEQLERHKKVLRDAKKAKKRRPETLKQDSIIVSSRSNKNKDSSEDETPLQQKLVIQLSNRKRKRVPASSSEDELAVDPRHQKHAKLNDSHLTAMEEDTPHGADSPTSLFSVPSSPEVPLVDTLSSPVSTANTSAAANIPTTAINVPQRSDRSTIPPSELTTGGGGISVKQRLGIGALAPTNPKTGPPPLKQVIKPPPRPQLPWAGLKIKKAPLSINTDTNPASGHEPSFGSAYSPPPTSNMSPNITDLTLSTSTPVSIPNLYRHMVPHETISPSLISQPPVMDEPVSIPNLYRHMVPNETISPSLISQSPVMDEAERFLQEIMPSGLADPLLPAQEPVVEPLPPMAVHPKPTLPGRIPKKWQWLGPLYLNASTSLFCDVRIHNSTDPKPSGMRFSVALEGMTSISITSLHNVSDLRSILPAFRPWTQLALLSPQEEKDHDPFKVIYRYLEKSLKVILKPILLDDIVIGQILISPPGLMNILHLLKLPPGFAQPDNLVVVLLPWALSRPQITKEGRLPNSESHTPPTMLESDRWTRSIRVKPGYQHALRILDFPEELHSYMHDRPFCVWNHRTSAKNTGLETKLLYNIMEQARAKRVGYSNEARVVFVHVSALTSLHSLPGLVERRSKRPHVHFYTYGSHEDVFPSIWSVKEIYPCGGIITFSPSAMFHNPIDMLHKIRQINAHSLWECYILPSALGMLAKMVCGDDDPMAVFERGEFSHEFILNAIAAGEVALIHAPPERATTHDTNDYRQIWMRQYLSLTSFTARRALEFGVKAFHSKYANLSESEWPQRIETEILTDLSSMQRQPAIMKDYRRYVVFISELEARSNPNSGGMEWTTISKFDFRDNFHPHKQIINA